LTERELAWFTEHGPAGGRRIRFPGWTRSFTGLFFGASAGGVGDGDGDGEHANE